MLRTKNILIVDGNIYQTIDLSQAIEAADGCVAGVATTVEEAADVLNQCLVHGAVIDCDLAEASDVVLLLHGQDVAMVLQVDQDVPQPLQSLGGKVGILARPVDSGTVLESLRIELGKAEIRRGQG